jgi:hypothetical protein
MIGRGKDGLGDLLRIVIFLGMGISSVTQWINAKIEIILT